MKEPQRHPDASIRTIRKDKARHTEPPSCSTWQLHIAGNRLGMQGWWHRLRNSNTECQQQLGWWVGDKRDRSMGRAGKELWRSKVWWGSLVLGAPVDPSLLGPRGVE